MPASSTTEAVRRRPVFRRVSTTSDEGQRLAEAPTKRRRIGVACTLCRLRKSRCNGKRPKCSLCESLDADCAYESAESTSGYILNKAYVVGLENRIVALEAKTEKLSKLAVAGLATSNSPYLNKSPTSVGAASAHNEETWLPEEQPQEPQREEDATDAVAMSFLSNHDSGFFGPSSNIALLRQIEQVISFTTQTSYSGSTLGNDDWLSHPSALNIDVLIPSTPSRLDNQQTEQVDEDIDLCVLPLEADIRSMIHAYFTGAGLVFPYVHEQTFRRNYEEVSTEGFKRVRRTWLALLNMMFAMVKGLEKNSSNQVDELLGQSDIFYRRALGLCTKEMLWGSNIETVQCLLLMTQYLQGTKKSVQTWTIHGLAVKAAFSIGLHSPGAYRNLGVHERETRKRAWWGCVILDRILSTAFGRPTVIPEDHCQVELPEPLDNEMQGAASFDSVKALTLEFFRNTILLHKITNNVLVLLYEHNLACGDPLPPENIGPIFELEKDLGKWRQSLPESLSIYVVTNIAITTISDSPTYYAERFRLLLTLRYLNLQVLLYRPALSAALSLRMQGNSSDRLVSSWPVLRSNFVDSCVRSSEEMISILHFLTVTQRHGPQLLGAWWFSLYYVFNASLVIFGRIMSTPLALTRENAVPPHISQGGFYIKQAGEVVKNLYGEKIVIQRCAEYLEYLSTVIESWVCNTSIGNDDLELSNPEFQLNTYSGVGLPLSGSIVEYI